MRRIDGVGAVRLCPAAGAARRDPTRCQTDKVVAAYGSWAKKSMYGRTTMGIDRSTFLIGADGRIVRVWRKVKVPGHAAEVLRVAASA